MSGFETENLTIVHTNSSVDDENGADEQSQRNSDDQKQDEFVTKNQLPINEASILDGGVVEEGRSIYEDMFEDRYTMVDDDYRKAVESSSVDVPPCIHPWFGRPKRNFDYAKANQRKRPYEESRSNDGEDRKHYRRYEDRGGRYDRGDQRHGYQRSSYNEQGRERHYEQTGRVGYPGKKTT